MSSLVRAHVAHSNAIIEIGKKHEQTINKIAKEIKRASEAGEMVIRISRPNQFGYIEPYFRHFGYICQCVDSDIIISWRDIKI